jgi:secondary thiamine-phosphate synthase enzyme
MEEIQTMKTSASFVQLTETGVRMPFHSRMPLSIAGQLIHCDTRHKLEFVNLTEPVEKQIAQSGICEGLAVVQSLHSTAAVFVNEWQDALLEDLRTLLEESVRPEGPWRHNDPRYSDCDRGNAASHLRALLLGTNAVLSVSGGRLLRGQWQSIILAELDGPGRRSISVRVFGAEAAALGHTKVPRSLRRWLE